MSVVAPAVGWLIPGAGHFDVIDPQSEAWPVVLAALGKI